MNNKARRRQVSRTWRPFRVEELEVRRLLSAQGIVWGGDAYLSLSFAPDGTDIAGEQNLLFAKFNQVAQADQWQHEILRAFQTWAVQTNSDIALQEDAGQPFGSDGQTKGDMRFGDIRIGARPLREGFYAISVPQDLVSGTWVGDVIFNSEADYDSLDTIFAVALHEAGNVFGLLDNANPDSPLDSTDGFPTARAPSGQDIADLQQLYGERLPDANDRERANDTPDRATDIVFTDDVAEGSTPGIVFGDLRDGSDVDVYRFDPVGGYSGPVTLQVSSNRISLLQPTITVRDRAGTVLGTAESRALGGDTISVRLDTVSEDDKYFVTVSSTAEAPFDVGGYSLVATFDNLLKVPREVIGDLLTSEYRSLEQDDIQRIFAPENESYELPLLNDDAGLDDARENATVLKSDSGAATNYQATGSFASVTDVDNYSVAAPPFEAGVEVVMTVLVRSFEGNSILKSLTATQDDHQAVPSRILVNRAGDYVVEFSGIKANKEYFLRLEPVNQPITGAWNYELNVRFRNSAVELVDAGQGSVTAMAPVSLHELVITEHQLTLFILEARGADPVDGAIAQIFDSSDSPLVTLATPAGETRSASSVLLPPGDYRVQVDKQLASGGPVEYFLWMVRLTDPLAVPPDGSITDPVVGCPGIDPDLCFPGDANMDGIVDFGDFVILASNFGVKTDAAWTDGDFDASHTVDFADFVLLAMNFGQPAAPLPTAPVPAAPVPAAVVSAAAVPAANISADVTSVIASAEHTADISAALTAEEAIRRRL